MREISIELPPELSGGWIVMRSSADTIIEDALAAYLTEAAPDLESEEED